MIVADRLMPDQKGDRENMRLVITVDIDMEESGLDSDGVKDNIVQFTRDLLVIGAGEQGIGLALREVEYSDIDCSAREDGQMNMCSREDGNGLQEELREIEKINRRTYEKLQGVLCRLEAYKATGATPSQIRAFSAMYLEKCQEVNRLRRTAGTAGQEKTGGVG